MDGRDSCTNVPCAILKTQAYLAALKLLLLAGISYDKEKRHVCEIEGAKL